MIDIENLSANFTGIPLFENVNLKINKGDRICLVGVNGSGKSTFLKILAGIEVPASGQVRKQKGIRIGYLPQEIIDFENHKLFDYVKNSLYLVKQITKEENAINSLLAKGIELEKNADLRERLARLNSLKETHNYYALDSEIKKSLIA
jgi:ATPase subunit of ABC transporter with duplicated ATPase domains